MKKLVVVGLIVAVGLLGAFLYLLEGGRDIDKNVYGDVKWRLEKRAPTKKLHTESDGKNLTNIVYPKSAVIPLIDPSVCKDNPMGYLYFKVGEEVFRYTKDSPIQISIIDSESQLRKNRKSHPEGVPEGCAGNPYLGVSLSYKYDDNDEGYKKINGLGVSFFFEPLGGGGLSVAQSVYRGAYSDFLKNESKCEFIGGDLERCMWPNTNTYYFSIYRSESEKILGNSFIFKCDNFVGDIKCGTFYHLYPSISFSYHFFIYENKDWNDSSLIYFDRYLRGSIEAMRVQ